MSPTELDEIRKRIARASQTVQQTSGEGYEISYIAEGTDFVTSFRAIGMKAPEQLQDDFLNLFVWTWNLKDYIKECFKAKGLSAQDVEEVVNRSLPLMYVSDVANRAKHGTLHKSRSGGFAELVGVGFELPMDSIAQVVVAGPEITLHVKDPQLIRVHATIKTQRGEELDALVVLEEAINTWESLALVRIAA